MWNWAHFNEEGWLSHTKRSARLSVLFLLAGTAMVAHMIIPFWQQPEWLCAERVADKICQEMNSRRE